MPKQLKVHSGERVDLVDYVHGANTYTQEAQKFAFERMLLDRRNRILDGFRVRVEDQTVNPGMITVYNGNVLDRTGQLINNEQTPNDSRSITLLGANLNFYVEIQFLANESDTDARFFWDPTTTNTPPMPDGSELGLNVATRLAPDWTIVSPVSTTSFDQTANANTIKVPVGVFRTDGANRIVVGATNPGLTLVRAASVLEGDVAAGVSTIRVVDSRFFPSTTPFSITVDSGGTTPEARTVSAVDRDNGILSLTAALGSNHSAGAIVVVASGTADTVRENTDPSDPALDSMLSPPGHPDLAQRLWQANETRGSALIQSKETFGARDDLNIRSLKDQIDFLSAQIRELKFGHPRPDTVSAAPPLSFATRPRWFDKAGGVQGARSNTVSIGNGTTSFGDFNGTNGSTVLAAAIAALPASGGTIFVKAGTYNFASTVTASKAITIIGEQNATVIFNSTNAGGAAISTSGSLSFQNISLQRGGGAAVGILDITAATTVVFRTCSVTGQVRLVAASPQVLATETTFTHSAAQPSFLGTTNTSTLTSSRFDRCNIVSTGWFINAAVNDVVIHGCYGSALALLTVVDGAVTEFVVSNSTITLTSVIAVGALSTFAVDGVTVRGNRFIIPAMGPLGYVLGFFQPTAQTNRVVVDGNFFSVTGGTTNSSNPGAILWIGSASSSRTVHFAHNCVEANTGSFIVGVQLDQNTLTDAVVADNAFYRTYDMVRVGGTVGTLSAGNIIVRGNIHDNASEHSTIYGVRIVQNALPERLSIQDNTFLNYSAASGVGTRIACDITTNANGAGKFEISGNHVYGIGNGSLSAHFVYYAPAGPTSNHDIVIENNHVDIVFSPTTNSGIYLGPGGASNANSVKIRGNRINAIGAVGTQNAYGIFVANHNVSGNGASVVVENNHVQVVYGEAIGTGIEVQNCGPCVVANNAVSAVQCTTGAIPATGGCGIRFNNATTSSNDLRVINNSVDQSLSATPANSQFCIVLYLNNTNLTGFAVDGNSVRTSTTSSHPIFLNSVLFSEGYRNGSVSRNSIDGRSASSSVYLIHLYLGGASYGIKVSDNIMSETYVVALTSHCGIHIIGRDTGGEPYGIAVTDNIILGPKAGLLTGAHPNRVGIKMNGALKHTIVNNNVVDWNEPALITGIGIQYTNVAGLGVGPFDQHVVVGNMVRGDNDGTSGGEIDIDTTGTGYRYGFVVANNLGTAGGVGTIVPGAPAAGWDYGGLGGTIVPGAAYAGINKLS